MKRNWHLTQVYHRQQDGHTKRFSDAFYTEATARNDFRSVSNHLARSGYRTIAATITSPTGQRIRLV